MPFRICNVCIILYHLNEKYIILLLKEFFVVSKIALLQVLLPVHTNVAPPTPPRFAPLPYLSPPFFLGLTPRNRIGGVNAFILFEEEIFFSLAV